MTSFSGTSDEDRYSSDARGISQKQRYCRLQNLSRVNVDFLSFFAFSPALILAKKSCLGITGSSKVWLYALRVYRVDSEVGVRGIALASLTRLNMCVFIVVF